jgi:hypothetical protein
MDVMFLYPPGATQENHENLRISSVLATFRTKRLPNMSLSNSASRYKFTKLLTLSISEQVYFKQISVYARS